MNPEPDPVESLFASVLAKPAEERAAYLDQACAGDPDLRLRVEALLKADAEAAGQSFLTEPYRGLSAAQPASEKPGTRIGPYKLLQQIGEGGMGVVYMAEQEQPVRRRVALKIIKPGMDSTQVIARFEAERQALAMMDHTNIARVLDAGSTPSGRPYFVMELVHGVSITRFCDDNQLTLRQRLELFVPVCQAIQHAHQKGVIHRDIKPSNVLVTLYDDKPVPKVIDFGVAKAIEQRLTEKTLFTQYGTLVGTFEYMSPEQAEMNAFGVDTRSDIYSLGVLLYELLTGTTPLERERLRQAALDEVVRLIRQEEPPRPSARLSSSGNLPKIAAARKTEPARLTTLVRGELDWIVMRCLEKQRNRRYDTASALARDVERYLHDEPVEACPPSVGYRLRKFARKNRVVLATGTAFFMLMAVATAVSFWLAVRGNEAAALADKKRQEANVAHQEASDERDRANQEAARAKANAAETGRALDRMTVAKGIQLAEQGNLFAALPWFVKPLERGALAKEEEQIHRTRIACYMRHTKGRPRLRQLFFHDGPVSHAAWSADTKRVLTVCKNTVHVWDVESGKAITTLRHPAHVTTAQFTLDSSRVLAVAGSIVWCWDGGNGRQLEPPLIDWEGQLQKLLAMVAQTPLQFIGNIGLIDTEWDERPLEICRGGQRALFSYKGALRLLDLKTRRLIGQWPRSARWRVGDYDHALSPDGQKLLLIRDGLVTAIDTASGRLAERPINHETPVKSVALSPDGTRAVTIADDGTARIWDTTTWQQAARIRVVDVRYIGGSASEAMLSPDNRLLACCYATFGLNGFAWWDVKTGQLVQEIADEHGPQIGPAQEIALEYDPRVRFAWRPDGRQHVTESEPGAVTLWNDSDQREKALMLPHESPLSAAVYAPDGSTLLTATEDGTARIWDLRDRGEPVVMKTSREDDFSASIGFFRSFFLPGNGACVIYSDQFTMKTVAGSETIVWPDRRRIAHFLPPDTSTFRTFSGDEMPLGAISQDGSRGISVHERNVQLWDLMTGTRVGKPWKSSESLLYLAFSPDSRFVVSVSQDGAARLTDAKTGQGIGGPLKHNDAVNYAAFSPNCELLVTCSEDRMARLWWTQTGQPASDNLPHGDAVTSAAFSPNGQIVATAAQDGMVRIWDVAHGAPVGVLEQKKGFSCAFHRSSSLLLVTSFDTGNVSSPLANLRIWDINSLQEVSPAFKGVIGDSQSVPSWLALGFRFSRDDQFVVGPMLKTAFDLTPDRRPIADLVKLGQLYSERRLDAKGGAILLRSQELQTLWEELRAKYPDEFLVSPRTAVEWRIQQLQSAVQADQPDLVAFHRRWLAAELAEAERQPGERGNENMEANNYLLRLGALAIHGRHAETTSAADALASHYWSKDAEILHACACVHALAAGSVRDNAGLAERYANRAVVLLRQAVNVASVSTPDQYENWWYKYPDVIELRYKNPDLDSIRHRDDFRALLKKHGTKKP
jgi:eukaryotic-like serine/threonine-protein kinase